MVFRVLSWNIRQGGGTRADAVAGAVRSHNPDAVVLSEFRNNDSGLLLRTRLLVDGYLYQVATAAEPSKNSVLIASRTAGDSRLFNDRLDSFPESIALLSQPGFDLVGVYLPHKKKHTCFDVLMELAGCPRPAIFAGDFNTGVNGVDQEGSSFWYSDRLDDLTRAGYVDAFRLIQGEAREYSWFSHQGNGYRYDHTWVHRSMAERVVACSYSHQEREGGLSDHAIMLLDIDTDAGDRSLSP